MRSGKTVAVAAFSALVLLVAGLQGPRGEAGEPHSKGPLAQASDGDPFPLEALEHTSRVFEYRSGVSPDVTIYELCVTGRERLPDGEEYAVLETRTRPRASSVPRRIGREWLRRDASGIVCARRQEGPTGADLEPPQRVLELPLAVGKKWLWEGRAGGLACSSESRVVACDKVSVPMGTFESAWRIDTKTQSEKGDVLTRTIWLAPDVGFIEEDATITANKRTLRFEAKALREADSSGSARPRAKRRP